MSTRSALLGLGIVAGLSGSCHRLGAHGSMCPGGLLEGHHPLEDGRRIGVQELIDQLAVEYCVDPLRVHAMGQDSSASSVAALACEAPDRIASFYDGMGNFPPKCDSPRPVPLVSLTGDGDRYSVSRSVEAWAENNGCDPEPVDEDLGSGVTRKEYQGCEADVVLYDVEGAGHGIVRQGCLDDRIDYCIANDVFDQLRELREVAVMKTPAPCQFPDALDRIQFGTIGWQEVE